MSHLCPKCERALRPCEWCGESDLLTAGGETFPVTTNPGWDGNYHPPCWTAEQNALGHTLPEGAA